MRRRLVLLTLAAMLLGGVGLHAVAASPADPSTSPLAYVPTSPAGVDDEAPSTLPQELLQRGRLYRGNPLVLALVTGALLLVALGLGLFTLASIRRAHRSGLP